MIQRGIADRSVVRDQLFVIEHCLQRPDRNAHLPALHHLHHNVTLDGVLQKLFVRQSFCLDPRGILCRIPPERLTYKAEIRGNALPAQRLPHFLHHGIASLIDTGRKRRKTGFAVCIFPDRQGLRRKIELLVQLPAKLFCIYCIKRPVFTPPAQRSIPAQPCAIGDIPVPEHQPCPARVDPFFQVQKQCRFLKQHDQPILRQIARRKLPELQRPQHAQAVFFPAEIADRQHRAAAFLHFPVVKTLKSIRIQLDQQNFIHLHGSTSFTTQSPTWKSSASGCAAATKRASGCGAPHDAMRGWRCTGAPDTPCPGCASSG